MLRNYNLTFHTLPYLSTHSRGCNVCYVIILLTICKHTTPPLHYLTHVTTRGKPVAYKVGVKTRSVLYTSETSIHWFTKNKHKRKHATEGAWKSSLFLFPNDTHQAWQRGMGVRRITVKVIRVLAKPDDNQRLAPRGSPPK